MENFIKELKTAIVNMGYSYEEVDISKPNQEKKGLVIKKSRVKHSADSLL